VDYGARSDSPRTRRMNPSRKYCHRSLHRTGLQLFLQDVEGVGIHGPPRRPARLRPALTRCQGHPPTSPVRPSSRPYACGLQLERLPLPLILPPSTRTLPLGPLLRSSGRRPRGERLASPDPWRSPCGSRGSPREVFRDGDTDRPLDERGIRRERRALWVCSSVRRRPRRRRACSRVGA
jgi:hypothetical protein